MPDQIMQKIREVLDQNNCDYEQRERLIEYICYFIINQIIIYVDIH